RAGAQQVGSVGEQSPRALLCADCCRSPPPCERSAKLGTRGRRDGAHPAHRGGVTMRSFFARLCDLFRRRKLLAALDEDLQAHREELAEAYRARGMSPEEAQRAAALAMGNPAEIREAYRERAGLPLIETTLQD